MKEELLGIEAKLGLVHHMFFDMPWKTGIPFDADFALVIPKPNTRWCASPITARWHTLSQTWVVTLSTDKAFYIEPDNVEAWLSIQPPKLDIPKPQWAEQASCMADGEGER